MSWLSIHSLNPWGSTNQVLKKHRVVRICHFYSSNRHNTLYILHLYCVVEAGRVELPSEIAPWETSTCLVFRIDLIHLTPGDISQMNQFIVFLFARHEQPDEPVYVVDALMQNHRQILHRTGCRQLSSSHIAVIGTYCFFQVFKEIPGPPHAV